ncbi:MAG: PIN domain-containing protein [Chloroflexi bacterium]|nr:PIN domain-containing protein [Chloroflexota bacterium]
MFDLNVILDVLQARQPFVEDSGRSLAHAESGKIRGWVAAHSITTLHYLVSRDQSAQQAGMIITSLLQFLRVASVEQSTIEQALALGYRDFEDAVQMICALQAKADYLTTRNPKDFQPAPVAVLQPAELNALLAGQVE